VIEPRLRTIGGLDDARRAIRELLWQTSLERVGWFTEMIVSREDQEGPLRRFRLWQERDLTRRTIRELVRSCLLHRRSQSFDYIHCVALSSFGRQCGHDRCADCGSGRGDVAG